MLRSLHLLNREELLDFKLIAATIQMPEDGIFPVREKCDDCYLYPFSLWQHLSGIKLHELVKFLVEWRSNLICQSVDRPKCPTITCFTSIIRQQSHLGVFDEKCADDHYFSVIGFGIPYQFTKVHALVSWD